MSDAKSYLDPEPDPAPDPKFPEKWDPDPKKINYGSTTLLVSSVVLRSPFFYLILMTNLDPENV